MVSELLLAFCKRLQYFTCMDVTMIINSRSPYTTSRIDLFARQLLDNTNTRVQDFLFIDPYSVGDVVHTLSLMNEFKRRYCIEGQRVNFLCNTRGLGVAKLFRNVNFVAGANFAPLEFQIEAIANRYEALMPGVPIVMCPDMYSRGFLGRMLRENVISATTARKLILELDLSVRPELPELDPAMMSQVKIRASQMGLQPGSIIIFNHGHSIESVDEEYFKPLREFWPDRVFYDASVQNRGRVSWAKPLTMTIEEIPYFVKIAGAAFTIRSGITDLLSISGAKIITLYANSHLLPPLLGDRVKTARSYRKWTLADIDIGHKTSEFPIFLEEEETVENIHGKIREVVSDNFFN